MDSSLDYRNCLSIDIKQSLVGQLQLDQTAAAYLLLSIRRYNNVLLALADLATRPFPDICPLVQPFIQRNCLSCITSGEL